MGQTERTGDPGAPRSDGDLGPARVVVRPIGTPLPLGFLALLVATVSFAALSSAGSRRARAMPSRSGCSS